MPRKLKIFSLILLGLLLQPAPAYAATDGGVAIIIFSFLIFVGAVIASRSALSVKSLLLKNKLIKLKLEKTNALYPVGCLEVFLLFFTSILFFVYILKNESVFLLLAFGPVLINLIIACGFHLALSMEKGKSLAGVNLEEIKEAAILSVIFPAIFAQLVCWFFFVYFLLIAIQHPGMYRY